MYKFVAVAAVLAVACFAQANMLANGTLEANDGPYFAGGVHHWDGVNSAPHGAHSGYPGSGWTPGHPVLMDNFGYLTGDPPGSGAALWGMQVLSTNPAYNNATSDKDVAFTPNTTYDLNGWLNDGGTAGGTLHFEIGYLTSTDLNDFVTLATAGYEATDVWTEVAGVSYTTAAAGPEIGQPIVVRLIPTYIPQGGSDVWFDEIVLTPEPTSLVLLALGALIRRR